MKDLFPFVIIVGIIAAVIVGIIWRIYAERKRTEKMQQAAKTLGLPFYSTGDPALLNKLANFRLFTQGRSRKIKNMIHGETEEVEIGIFDY